MKKIILLLLLGYALLADELSFIALDKGSWQIVVCKKESCKNIKTQQEPRTYDYDFATGRVVYVASDKSVRTLFEGNESIILESQKDAYTQPLFIKDGQKIMIVKLVNGNSKNTEIISMDLLGKNHKLLHYQYSTALEPYSISGNKIYYANVSCVEGCGDIIQEIWEKDTISGQAKQLTLLNAISHQPTIDHQQKNIYFSSKRDGNYHIYHLSLEDGTITKLTKGDITDGFPIASKERLYFIRREGREVKLMSLKENILEVVKLPKSYQKIRNLKVRP
jgi:Tol biopolymer transport system component